MLVEKNQNVTLYILLITSSLMHLANYLVIPILPIFLSVNKNINTFLIGIIISINLIFIEVGSLLGGILSDRINHKYVLAIGAFIHAISMFLFSFMSDFYFLTLFWSLSGIGHGILAPTIKCGLSDLCADKNLKQKVFSKRGIYANIGLFIAGLAILIGLGNYMNLIFIISSFILVITFILAFFIKSKHNYGSKIKFNEYFKLIKNRSVLFLGLLILLINFGYAQLSYLLPLKLDKLTLPHTSVGLIWLVMSLEVILFQNIITKKVISKLRLTIILLFASLFFSIGVIFIGFANSLVLLVVSAFILTIGQMLITPSIDTSVGNITDESTSGLMYSLAHLLHGLGQALGTTFSALIISYNQLNFTTFLIVSLVLFSISIVILLVRKSRIIALKQP